MKQIFSFLILLVVFLYALSAESAVVWDGGGSVATYNNRFIFGNSISIDALNTDPSASSASANLGSMLFGNGKLYIKQDNGLTTNWNRLLDTNDAFALPSQTNNGGKVLTTNGVSTSWKPNNNNLLINGEFENPTVQNSWTLTSGSSASSSITLDNSGQSIALSLTAQTLDFYQDYTTSAQWAGVPVSISKWVKSSEVLYVCPRVNGASYALTSCLATSNDNQWHEYIVPFVAGTTSIGAQLSSSGAITSTVYVDDAVLRKGIDTKAVSDISNPFSFISTKDGSNNLGTDTIAGVGVVEFSNIQELTNSNSAELEITNDTTGLRITVKKAGTITITSNIQRPQTTYYDKVGKNGSPLRAAGTFTGVSTWYGEAGGAWSIEDRASVGDYYQFQANGGWSNNSDQIYVTASLLALGASSNTYSQNRVYPSAFTARITSAGVVSDESYDFINGNCAVGSSIATCTFNTSIFTVAPVCNAIQVISSARFMALNAATSTTTVTLKGWDDAAGAALNDFNITCNFAGADGAKTTTITGTFADVNRIAYLKDVKTSGTAGGSAVAGVQTRTLNTVYGDASIVSLSANQFTLQAGVYDISFSAPARNADTSQAYIYNVTDSSEVAGLIGSSELPFAGQVVQTISVGSGTLVLTSTKTFELRHQTQSASATSGLGFPTSFGRSEIYSQVRILKVR